MAIRSSLEKGSLPNGDRDTPANLKLRGSLLFAHSLDKSQWRVHVTSGLCRPAVTVQVLQAHN